MSVKLIKFFDKYFGSVICAILGIFSSKKNPKNYDKILIIQLWGIGETILALPAIKATRSKFKKSRLEILVTKRNSDIFYKNQDFDNLLILKLNPISILFFIIKNFRKYNIAIDLEEYLNISSIITFFV